MEYRVARGFEETWGRLRNSSRSIVPELSWCPAVSFQDSCARVWRRGKDLVELHEPLSQSVDFIFVDWEVGVSACAAQVRWG